MPKAGPGESRCCSNGVVVVILFLSWRTVEDIMSGGLGFWQFLFEGFREKSEIVRIAS